MTRAEKTKDQGMQFTEGTELRTELRAVFGDTDPSENLLKAMDATT